MKSTTTLALLCLAFAASGCAKADKAACEKMAEHDYGILDQNTKMSANPTGKKLLAELKQKTVDACTDKWPASRVECHMKATTTKEMDACDPEE